MIKEERVIKKMKNDLDTLTNYFDALIAEVNQ